MIDWILRIAAGGMVFVCSAAWYTNNLAPVCTLTAVSVQYRWEFSPVAVRLDQFPPLTQSAIYQPVFVEHFSCLPHELDLIGWARLESGG